MHGPFMVLNALLCFVLPVVAAVLVRRRFGLRWSLLAWGALTFVLSQVVHIPLNAAVAALWSQEILPPLPAPATRWLLPLGLGLSAGLCEEVARWLMLRSHRLRDVRDARRGIVFGLGHGGIEAVIVAVMAGIGAVNIMVLQGADLAAMGLDEAQQVLIREQVDSVLALPAWMMLLGAFERACTLVCHVAMSLLVVRAVRDRAPGWLLLSILFHTLLNAGAVLLVTEQGPLAAEAWVGAFALLASGIILAALRQSPPAAAEPAPPVAPAEIQRVDIQRAARQAQP